MRIYLFMIISLLTATAKAQEAKTSELFLTLKKVDSTFFERSFNLCDIAFLEKAIHKDLNFYHDQGGIQNRQQFLDAVKNNLCSTPNDKPIRKVDAASLEVFPMYNNGVLYGAIQTGVHRFFRRQPGKQDMPTSIAKFTHLYLLENGNWILREVLSYDHKEAK